MEEMGMTDKQFVALAKSLQKILGDAVKETDTEKKNEKIESVIELLQESIEA